MANYSCPLCTHSTLCLKLHVKHLRLHKNVANFTFSCALTTCSQKFKSYHGLRVHTDRIHSDKTRQLHQKVLNSGSRFACTYESCNPLRNERSEVIKHLTDHLKKSERVECPFEGCIGQFSVRSSFTSHISRLHAQDTLKHLFYPDNPTSADNTRTIECAEIDNLNCNDVGLDEEEEDCNETMSEEELENEFLNTIALFYLRLQAKLHLPTTTVEEIIQGLTDMHEFNDDHMKATAKKSLQKHNIPEDVIAKVLDDLTTHDLIKKLHKGPLRSDYKRKQTYKKSFNYIDPVAVDLGLNEANKRRQCHYIPILETLHHVFSDPSVQIQWKNGKPPHVDNFYQDIPDGCVYRNNPLFIEDESAVKLILYQDSFEVCNPLGSAKKKHKILAVYTSFVDLFPWNRFKVDTMQLVLLCRESDMEEFGIDKVFSMLVEDLIVLENRGFQINNQYIRGAVVAICGDNLGSHCLGGFVQNFSTAKYFCRYCLIRKEEFQADTLFNKEYPSRTSSNYDEMLAELQMDENEESVMGIKVPSVFNKLKYFHVCNPGLPPCLGHDLFEGVVQYDLALYLNYFVKIKHWFSYKFLNRSLVQLKCLGSDAKDKPAPFNKNGKKLVGHAAQNWCCLRLITILVGSKIREPDDPVWQTVLLLKKIVSFVCLRSISAEQICYLKTLIEEYLISRKELFPGVNLRCKHHYLMHYPSLICQFGPLINVWTLRFESKHMYFKAIVKASKNFINVTKTMAEMHELFQAYLRHGQMFQASNGETDDGFVETSLDLYSELVGEAVRSCARFVTGATLSASQFVQINGSEYKAGLFVVVSRDDDGAVTFGQIKLLLRCGTVNHIIVQIANTWYDFSRDLYIVRNLAQRYKCVHYNELIDFHPLPAYTVRNQTVITLKHAV